MGWRYLILAAGVAHELRNPLAVISLKTQNLPDTEELKEKIFDPFFSTRHEGVGFESSYCGLLPKSSGSRLPIPKTH